MKTKTSILSSLILMLWCLPGIAQVDPGTEHLRHQYTFDDGTANDGISTQPVHGVLSGGATIQNNALQLNGSGQYLQFPAAAMAINTYPVISQEIWFTPKSGANTGYTMLSYFGNANSADGLGYNYLSTSAARGDNVSRTAISDGTYNSEIGANGQEYDDGNIHHMVSVLRPDSILLYLDGSLAAKTANTIALSDIGTAMAALGKGGYNNDPTWVGSISKYSIYSQNLGPDEVAYLYQQGSETSPFIQASVGLIAFDENYLTQQIYITSANLTGAITIEAPEGLTVEPVTLPSNANSAPVRLTYDGTTPVNGVLTFKSGETQLEVPIAVRSNACFTPLYPALENLIPDPWVSDLAQFAGWGSRSINTDPSFSYCGVSSGKISGNNAGSLDVDLSGKLKPQTTYRVKAWVYGLDGAFQVGVLGWSSGQGDLVRLTETAGEWNAIDFEFTTGSVLPAKTALFFNNYGLGGTTGYIDNWEMYAIPKIYPSVATVDFNSPGTHTLTFSATGLTDAIQLATTDGFSVSPASIAATANNTPVTITYNGISTSTGYLRFNSGTYTDSIALSGSIDPGYQLSKNLLLVDEIHNTASFQVHAFNLSQAIELTAPEGITLSPTQLPTDANGQEVTVTYDALQTSSGYIMLSSGSFVDSLELFADHNSACFQPLYTDRENLIQDPTCNTYLTDGWGAKGINADPAYVYCGSRSGMVNNSGSLNRDLTGVLKPNTTYRMKAMTYKASNTGENMGKVTYTLTFDSLSHPEPYRLIKEAMDSACSYFSKYTPFIENVRVVYSAGIPTAQASYHGEMGFGANTRYMWVGTVIHELAHYFGSGTTDTWRSKFVDGVWTGASASALIKSLNGGEIRGDSQHYWPYGINQREEITNLGSQQAQEKALIDAVKIIKAMLVDDCKLPTNNTPVGLGVYGWDTRYDDLYEEVSSPNSWQDLDFTFTTGTLGSTCGVYFNRGTGYIDNWELYELSGDARLSDLKINSNSIEGFSPDVFNYEIQVDSKDPISLEAIPNNANSTLTIPNLTSIPGKRIVRVLAEDGQTLKTYTLDVVLKTGASTPRVSPLQVSPSITSGSISISGITSETDFRVYSLGGELVWHKTTTGATLEIELDNVGVYLIQAISNSSIQTFKVIKKP